MAVNKKNADPIMDEEVIYYTDLTRKIEVIYIVPGFLFNTWEKKLIPACWQ